VILTNAIRIADAATEHARYVLVDMAREEDDEGVVLAWLRRNRASPVSAREIQRSLSSRFKNVDSLKAALFGLEERGLVRLREQRHEAGRPSLMVEIHPALIA
jgi:hypothetical protein